MNGPRTCTVEARLLNRLADSGLTNDFFPFLAPLAIARMVAAMMGRRASVREESVVKPNPSFPRPSVDMSVTAADTGTGGITSDSPRLSYPWHNLESTAECMSSQVVMWEVERWRARLKEAHIITVEVQHTLGAPRKAVGRDLGHAAHVRVHASLGLVRQDLDVDPLALRRGVGGCTRAEQEALQRPHQPRVEECGSMAAIRSQHTAKEYMEQNG